MTERSIKIALLFALISVLVFLVRKYLIAEEQDHTDPLGPLQREWVQILRSYPELQLKGLLGKFDENQQLIGACCLGVGELLVCENQGILPKLEKQKEGYILLSGLSDTIFYNYSLMGLKTQNGSFDGTYNGFSNLANLNDSGVSWTEIAQFIENNPEKVFTKRV